MKTGTVSSWIPTVASLCLLMTAVLCTTNLPSGPDGWDGAITVSLVRKGNHTADYTGRDLDLIIEFEDSIEVRLGTNFNIHSLRAQIYHTTEIITHKKVKTLTVPLYWETVQGLPRDSAMLPPKPYDSIYVRSGLSTSNVVRANIFNLPPVVKGLRVDDSVFTVPPHIVDVLTYTYFISETTDSVLDLTLTVLDPDDSYYISWGILAFEPTPEIEKYLSYATTAAHYNVRKGKIRDVVSSLINDGDKQIHIKVKMVRRDTDDVKIDSIRLKCVSIDTSFKNPLIDKHIVNVITQDSIASLRVYPHFPGGSIRWSAVNGVIAAVPALDSNGYAVTYVCTLSTRTDSLKTDLRPLIDSIRFVYSNKYGDDSTAKVILIRKKPANRNPVIDSILIGAQIIKKDFSVLVEAGTDVPLAGYAHDPEGGVRKGTIRWTWHGLLNGSLDTTAGDSNTYTVAAGTYTDSLYVIAYDTMNFTDTQLIVIRADQAPVIDSIRIDSMYYKTGYRHVVNADGTIKLKARAHDPELTTLSYKWQGSTIAGKLLGFAGDSIRYTAPAGNYSDTIYLIVTDSSGFTDIQAVILPCNNKPVFDSIRVADTVVVPSTVTESDSVYSLSIPAPDTFVVKAFAHDRDSGLSDVIASYQWTYKSPLLTALTSTADSIRYISANNAYSDTITCRIRDRYSLQNRKKVIITFLK